MTEANQPAEPKRRPKQARARARLERILDATRTELEQREHSDITMERIAMRAEVPIGSLYQFFGSKTALLVEVAAMAMGQADTRMAQTMSECLSLPWREAVDRALEASLGFLSDSPHYRRILRSMRFTKEFAEVTLVSNHRVADLMSLHPSFARNGIQREKALQICRTSITAINALQDRALSEDQVDFESLLAESKRITKAYIGTYIP